MSGAARLFAPDACKRLVIKIGSSLLIGRDGSIRRDWLATLVAEIAARHKTGQQVILVSSGAIALGARRLGMAQGGRASLADAQAAASVGQIALSGLWDALLAAENLVAAQILLTLDDLEDRRRYLNATATLERLLEAGAVPVINENDSVATAEIRFGDNDRLAARIAQAAGADGVVLLSDVDGLYDKNPGLHADAQRLAEVRRIDAAIIAMADGGSASGMGSGGMASKVQAAQIAVRAGIALAITSGQPDHPLGHWQTSGCGTIFLPRARQTARKNWLGGRIKAHGSVTVDAGAAKALLGGSSLLAAGVIAVSGAFRRGDVVQVLATDGTVLARGLAEYDAGDCIRVMGRKSGELEAILGYAPRTCIVHRDQMVVL